MVREVAGRADRRPGRHRVKVQEPAGGGGCDRAVVIDQVVPPDLAVIFLDVGNRGALEQVEHHRSPKRQSLGHGADDEFLQWRVVQQRASFGIHGGQIHPRVEGA